MKKFIIRSLFVISQSVCAAPTVSVTPYLDLLEDQIRTQSPTSLEKMLEILPSSMKQKYLIVYNSRSTQSATIDLPRIILTTPDHQFFLSFSGNTTASDTSFDSRLEIIENYGLGDSRFAEITFINNRAQLNRSPTNCITCHRGSPIFDGYPHWPGFIGSTHNGRAYGENSGSGKIARLEFEEQALNNFIHSAPSHPRYRYLEINSSESPMDMAEMGRRNSIVGTAIIGRSHHRQSEQILKNAASIQEIEDAFILSKAMEKPESNVPLTAYLDPKYQTYRNYVEQFSTQYESRLNAAEENKIQRIKNLTEIYGTETDKLRIGQAVRFNATDTYRADYQPSPSVRTDLGIPVANVMNYFGNRARFRHPGLYYEYLKSLNPNLYPDDLGSAFLSRSFRDITGATGAEVLTESVVGFEDVNFDGFFNARNYRDLSELYAWVASPVKTIEWSELQNFPILRDQIVKVQNSYIAILSATPVFDIVGAKKFKDLKSLSPENRAKLEKLIQERTQSLVK